MRRVILGSVMFFAGMTLLPAQARAQVLVDRCNKDSLTVAQVEARVEWARRCSLIVNIGDPNNHSYGDYYESSAKNSFIGSAVWSGINETYVNNLYLSGVPYQTIDADGYIKWYLDPARKRARPYYGVYGSTSDITTNAQLYPHPLLSSCKLYSDPFGYNAVTTFYVNGYCEANNPTPLSNSTPVSYLTANTDYKSYYTLTVPAGVSKLTFETSGGTGDVDLYVKSGSAPTLRSYDCRPYLSSNNEVCTINNPSPGTWYVMLHAWTSYSNVSLVGRY